MLVIAKSLEILPRHDGYGFASESFTLNWYIFNAINKKLLLQLKHRLNTKLFPNSVELIGYLASAVIVESSNPCVGS